MRIAEKRRTRVAIFGGSFNPPHLAHGQIAKWLFSKGLADELWVIPCFIHPFGKGLAPFKHRMEMCRLMFGKLALPIRVLDVEEKLGGLSHTIRTVEYLKLTYPDKAFRLLVGGDVAEQVDDWHDFAKIKREVGVIEVPRGESSPIIDISSTAIRENIAKGRVYRHMVEPEIAVYIVTKGLYRE
jgi:nicotinate-nucleotide adenylyltransferase